MSTDRSSHQNSITEERNKVSEKAIKIKHVVKNKHELSSEQFSDGRRTAKQSGQLNNLASIFSQDLRAEINFINTSDRIHSAGNDGKPNSDILSPKRRTQKKLPLHSVTIASCQSYTDRILAHRYGKMTSELKLNKVQLLLQQQQIFDDVTSYNRNEEVYKVKQITERFANVYRRGCKSNTRHEFHPLPMPFMPKPDDPSHKMPLLIDRFIKSCNRSLIQGVHTSRKENYSEQPTPIAQIQAIQNLRDKQYTIIKEQVSEAKSTFNVQFRVPQVTSQEKLIYLRNPETQELDPDFRNEITYGQVPFDEFKFKIDSQLKADVLLLKKLDRICFNEFVWLHQIQPKVFMLHCDLNIDLNSNISIQESKQIDENLKDLLVQNAKQRQKMKIWQNSISQTDRKDFSFELEKQNLNFITIESNPPSHHNSHITKDEIGAQKVQQLTTFEIYIRNQVVQLKQRNFKAAIETIKRAFYSFTASMAQLVLRFNWGVTNLMLGEYNEAIKSYLSIIDELTNDDSERARLLLRNSIHNLIIAVGLGQPSGFKELFQLIQRKQKKLEEETLQKMIAFVKSNLDGNPKHPLALPRTFIMPYVERLSPKQQRILRIKKTRRSVSPTRNEQQSPAHQVCTPLTATISNIPLLKLNIYSPKPFYKNITLTEQEIKKPHKPMERGMFDLMKERERINLLSQHLDKISKDSQKDQGKVSLEEAHRDNETINQFDQKIRQHVQERIKQCITYEQATEVDDLVRKIEKVELAMQRWNKSGIHFDPVQTAYITFITSIKQLCENPNICNILFTPLTEKNQWSETIPMSILRESLQSFVSNGLNASDYDKSLLKAKIEYIRRSIQEELDNPQRTACKGPSAAKSIQRAYEAFNYAEIK